MISNDYFEAFSRFMETNDPTLLRPFLDNNANLEYLQVYRNGAFKSTLAALSSNFPTVKKLLGHDLFNTIGKEFVTSKWPDDGSLSNYGALFPTFLSHASISNPDTCVDIANLDWAWLQSLFSKSETALTGNDLVEIVQSESDSSDKVGLVASAFLIQLKQPSLSEWLQIKFGDDIESNSSSKAILFWRQNGSVSFRSLSNTEVQFIKTIDQSGSLTKGAEAVVDLDSTIDISELFSNIINAGLFSKRSPKNTGV